jgi:ParB-like chromosome segregation protein Spo0J
MTSLSARIASADTVMRHPLQLDIAVASIEIPANHRKHHPHAVRAMAENINLHGLEQPIEAVRLAKVGDDHRLIFGSLRLQAVQLLGWSFIPTFVREADEFGSELALRLRSIFENLYRSQLTALDWSVAVADWCEMSTAEQNQASVAE